MNYWGQKVTMEFKVNGQCQLCLALSSYFLCFDIIKILCMIVICSILEFGQLYTSHPGQIVFYHKWFKLILTLKACLIIGQNIFISLL